MTPIEQRFRKMAADSGRILSDYEYEVAIADFVDFIKSALALHEYAEQRRKVSGTAEEDEKKRQRILAAGAKYTPIKITSQESLYAPPKASKGKAA